MDGRVLVVSGSNGIQSRDHGDDRGFSHGVHHGRDGRGNGDWGRTRDCGDLHGGRHPYGGRCDKGENVPEVRKEK